MVIYLFLWSQVGAINYSKEKCCIGRGLAALTVDKLKYQKNYFFGF